MLMSLLRRTVRSGSGRARRLAAHTGLDRLMPGTELRRNLKFRLRVLSLVPPLTGFAAMALLASIPQMREVYLGVIESHDVTRAAMGFGALALLSGILYVWHFWIGTDAVNTVYPEHADLDLDLTLMTWRDRKALLCAALPFVGLVIGLFALHVEATSVSGRFSSILGHLEPEAGGSLRSEFKGTGDTLRLMWAYITVALGLVFALLGAMHTLLRRSGTGHELRTAIAWVAGVVTVLLAVVPLLAPDRTVDLARALGPLAVTGLVLTGISTFLAGCSWAIKSIDPALSKGLSAAIAVLACLLLLLANVGEGVNPRQTSGPGIANQPPAAHLKPLRESFKQWLEQRDDRSRYAGRRYPVFVLAAQGGGIYATSAAALFLAAMQDECANFAQHTFAISGVSGGAVGAAVFAGLLEGKSQSKTLCAGLARGKGSPPAQPLTDVVERIVLDDHLSPVVGLIAPDFLRKAWPVDWLEDFDRSDALERSFACSFDRIKDGGVTPPALPLWSASCPQTANGTGLRADYPSIWHASRLVPAAILNTTWAEMGYRVAFAPFPLKAIGDGTLFNLYELPMPEARQRHSLIEAAFVSARFPGIVPARRIEPSYPGLRWNLVDGAYVDNSGATTAVELYKALERIAQLDGHSVDLRLVLLTNAETELDYGKIDGTLASDTIAPVSALLSVRNQLSQRAVTQAIAAVDPARSRSNQERRSPESKDHRVYIVDVEQQTFKLPLGWKISSVTNAIVRLMMGRPDLCPADGPARPAAPPAIKSMVDTIEQNSCVKRNLVRLLKAEG